MIAAILLLPTSEAFFMICSSCEAVSEPTKAGQLTIYLAFYGLFLQEINRIGK
jgi:hypothetical protein